MQVKNFWEIVARLPADVPVEPTIEPIVPIVEPDPADPAKSTEPVDPAAPKTPVIPPPVSWEQKRIAKLTAQKWELEERLAQQQKTTGATNPTDDARLEQIIEDRANVKANAKAAQITWDRECIAVQKAGKASYEDFDDKVKVLKQIDDGSEQASGPKYLGLIAALIETGEAPRLIYELADDLDKASELMELSPVKLGLELAKLSKAEPKEPVAPLSGAPKPIRPVGAKGAAHTQISPDDPSRADNLSTREWMTRRDAQAKANFEARRGY